MSANIFSVTPGSGGNAVSATFGTTSPTSSSPTLPVNATDGIATSTTRAISVYLSAATGVTLSGAGSLLVLIYSPILKRWARIPSLDVTLATSGVRDIGVGPFLTARFRSAGLGGGEQVAFIPSGVTFSAGSAGVTVTIVAENVKNSDIGA